MGGLTDPVDEVPFGGIFGFDEALVRGEAFPGGVSEVALEGGALAMGTVALVERLDEACEPTALGREDERGDDVLSTPDVAPVVVLVPVGCRPGHTR